MAFRVKGLTACLVILFLPGTSSAVNLKPSVVLFRQDAVYRAQTHQRLTKREISNEVMNPPKIKDLYISSEVSSRFATVSVFSKVQNEAVDGQEASFVVQIPESAFISNFSMVIDGSVQVAKVDEKKKVQQKYDQTKKDGQTAGQVRHKEQTRKRGMDIFNIDVNVAANSEVTFELTYLELLERRRGQYVQRISVQPLQIVSNLSIRAVYRENQEFGSFHYQLPGSTEMKNTSLDTRTILKATPTSREVIYKPSVADQERINVNEGIDGEFIVKYDVKHGYDGGHIIVEKGHFIHYFSPNRLSPLAKNIMFVIDTSGSMSGDKIKQTREAMKVILDKLRPDDHFNILEFDDDIKVWNSNPLQATGHNINSAKAYVDENIQAGGNTDINNALVEGIASLKNSFSTPGFRASMIVFLTDGEPTSGETNTKRIRENVLKLNANRHIAIFSLGFGFNVNFAFLKALSWENGGVARRVYAEEDASFQLSNFYLEIQSPVLLDLSVKYNNVKITDLTQSSFKLYFEGSELVVAGKASSDGISDYWTADVIGISASGKVHFRAQQAAVVSASPDLADFTTKLWAYLKIKDLLRMKAIASHESEASVLEQQALNLSITHNFVTPLTSFIIVKHKDKRYQDRYKDNSVSGQKSSRNGFIQSKQPGFWSFDSVSGAKTVCYSVLLLLLGFVVTI